MPKSLATLADGVESNLVDAWVNSSPYFAQAHTTAFYGVPDPMGVL